MNKLINVLKPGVILKFLNSDDTLVFVKINKPEDIVYVFNIEHEALHGTSINNIEKVYDGIYNRKLLWIKKELSFDKENHIALCNWLMDNPDKTRTEWPEWDFNGGTVKKVYNNDFVCDYARMLAKENNSTSVCDFCPLVTVGELKCSNEYSLDNIYRYAKNIKIRNAALRAIKNIPIIYLENR